MLTVQTESGSKQRSVRWVDDGRHAQEVKDGRRGSLPLATTSIASRGNSYDNNNSNYDDDNNNNNSNSVTDSGKKRASGPTAEHVQQLWAKYTQTTVMAKYSQEPTKGRKPQNDNVGKTGTTPAASFPTGSVSKGTPTATAAARTITTATPSTAGEVSAGGGGGAGSLCGSGFAEICKDADSQYVMKLSLPCPSHCSCCFCVYAKQRGPVRVYYSRFQKSKRRLPTVSKRGSLADKNSKNSLKVEEDDDSEPEKVFLKARWLTSSAPSGEVIVPEPPASLLEKMFAEGNQRRSVSAYPYSPPLCPDCGQYLLTKEHSDGCKHRHSHCFGDSGHIQVHGHLKLDKRQAILTSNRRKMKNTAAALAAEYGQYFAPTLPQLKAANLRNSRKIAAGDAGRTLHSSDSRSSSRSSFNSLDLKKNSQYDICKNYSNSYNNIGLLNTSPHWLISHKKDPSGFLRVPMNSPKGSRGPPRLDLGTGRNLGKRKDKRLTKFPSLFDAEEGKLKGPQPFPERNTPVQIRLLSKRASQ